MVEDGQRLAECRHDHPLAVLGPQPLEDGSWVVRAWLPEAERVELLLGDQRLPMANPHPPWVFAAALAHNPGCLSQLAISRGGLAPVQHDPLAFPTDPQRSEVHTRAY